MTRVRAWTFTAALVALAVSGIGGPAGASHVAAKQRVCPDERLAPGGDELHEPFRIKRLDDKSLGRARDIARRFDCTVRVVRRNGVDLVVQADLRPDRVNVAIRDHRIRRVFGVG